MNTKTILSLFILTLGTASTPTADAQDEPGAGGRLDRTVLPIPEPKVVPITTLDARDAKAPTQPFAFSADEGADVGVDGETNVSTDYKQGANAFTGKIIKVTVEQK